LLVILAVAAIAQAQAEELIINPLAPPDTSSPRATLKSFRENMKYVFQAYHEGRTAWLPKADPGEKRAIATLNTSALPPVRAERLAIGAALLLNEVLDRIPLPPYDEIPDEQAMADLPPGVPRFWRVPGTDIKIARVMEGPRTGEYLFSPQTVARAHEFYLLAENLAYRPGAMDGLFERISHAPGPWIPERWIRTLPHWAIKNFLGQSVWKWIAMFLTAGVWLLLVYAAHRFTRPRGEAPRYWLRFFLAVLLLPVTAAFRSFFQSQLLLIGPAFVVMDTLIVVLFYVIGATAILNLGAAIATTVAASSRFENRGLDANLINVACRSLAWLCAVLVLAKGASSLGVPLAAVIASLGVGGVAFALAARPTLENLIAGVTLYLDRPVRIGQFCQFDEVLGTVEHIGLRSTRIRRWGGNLLSVPNAQFAEYQLDNFNDARYIWIRQRLRLRYDTSTEQLSYILARIREMLFAHPKIVAPRVRLIGFGDDALTVEVICYSDTGVWAEWHAIREDVLLRVMEIIEAAGTRPALPSKTVYFTRDEGIDEKRRRAAEQQIREWTDAGELPFPDMSEAQREALAGTLDFPPEGSVQREAGSEKD
jgi:MscS family membrane protein